GDGAPGSAERQLGILLPSTPSALRRTHAAGVGAPENPCLHRSLECRLPAYLRETGALAPPRVGPAPPPVTIAP
ncbi:MAG TPA: hypothetical protein PKY01_07710, partial [Candidatus Hydrogenedentes bacterium]|nr:hypothetical protein [Candidatus Hydrogenedentota bacterium]